MIDTEFLGALEKLSLVVKKRVTSNLSGPRRSIAQGKGMLFKDHRIYSPGDDFRAIDWKVYARTDDLMIKNYEEERNLIVHIIVDKSLSMKYGKKFDYASMIGIGFAYLAMKNNDKFQFATFSDDLDVYQPRRGSSQLISMVDYMNDLKLKGKTDLLTMSQRYRKMIGSRSLVVIISDFLRPLDEIKASLIYFHGHELNLVQVLDSKEKNLEYEGDFKLKDSESESMLRTYISPKLKQDYHKRMEEHIANIMHECDIRGIKFHQVSTDMPIFDSFYKVLS